MYVNTMLLNSLSVGPNSRRGRGGVVADKGFEIIFFKSQYSLQNGFVLWPCSLTYTHTHRPSMDEPSEVTTPLANPSALTHRDWHDKGTSLILPIDFIRVDTTKEGYVWNRTASIHNELSA